jgi:hypothetical protein
MLYFIRYRTLDFCPIKVGFAEDRERLAGRMRAMESAAPYPIEALATLSKCGQATEKYLHHLLDEDCTNGGWFYPSGEVKAVVAVAQANPDASHAEFVKLVEQKLGIIPDPNEGKRRSSPFGRRVTRERRRQQMDQQVKDKILKNLYVDPDELKADPGRSIYELLKSLYEQEDNL